jgi:hypothetical protein
MVSILVPIIVGLLLTWQFYGFVRIKGELKSAESQWQAMEPLERSARNLTVESRANENLLAELNGWKKSHVDWHSHLLQLFACVPANIQVQSLRISQALPLVNDKVPARQFTMDLVGRALGEDAETSVTGFKRALDSDAALTNLIKKVEVSKFGADTTVGAAKTDRIFELRFGYRERLFE